MPPFRSHQRSDDRQPIHELSQTRQMFTDFNPWHARFDRPKLATNLHWSVHLQIEHVLMRRSSGQENHDDRFRRSTNPLLRLGLQELRQGYSTQCQPTNLQKGTPGNATAFWLCQLPNRRHGRAPTRERNIYLSAEFQDVSNRVNILESPCESKGKTPVGYAAAFAFRTNQPTVVRVARDAAVAAAYQGTPWMS